jgi:chromosomal replication initiation ATPase DnaA
VSDQLRLPFVRAPHFTDAGFLRAASNQSALAWLARRDDWPDGRLVLWGPASCGKTHLLQIWAAQNGTVQEGAALVLPDAPPTRPVAIDDADRAPERGLFHLLNAAAEAGLPVLLTARRPPARWDTALPDLASRLRAATAVEIRPAEDSLLRNLLASQLAERQLRVDDAVQDWLVARLERTPAAIRDAVDRLDAASLATSGRFTQRQAASVLHGLDNHCHPIVAQTAARAGASDPGTN